MNKAYYQAKLSEFVTHDGSCILGELTRSHGFALEHQQRQAWLDQIALLRQAVDAQDFLRNAYRVIMTRARQGMVIFVPKGSEADSTRVPALYDETFTFLRECGIEDLS